MTENISELYCFLNQVLTVLETIWQRCRGRDFWLMWVCKVTPLHQRILELDFNLEITQLKIHLLQKCSCNDPDSHTDS